MYNKILAPVDGSKPADKALEHAINLIKSISDGNNNNDKNIRIELIILFVIPDRPAPLCFEKPMRSAKTGKMVSVSNYIKEMHEAMKENALITLSEKKKKYGSTISNNVVLKTEVIVGKGLSISKTILNFADKRRSI
jgi:nucleotide-binding universal stress UspA family protein